MTFNPENLSETTLRKFVDNLVKHAKKKPISPKRSDLQEAVAAVLGFSNYHEAITALKSKTKTQKDVQKTANLSVLAPTKKNPTVSHLGISDIQIYKPSKGWFSLHGMEPVTEPEGPCASLCMGSDFARRAWINDMLLVNKDTPFLLIQGSMSLDVTSIEPQPSWGGDLDFSKASAQEIITDITESVSSSEGHSMWTGRATSLLVSVVSALVFLRDFGYTPLSRSSVKEHLEFDKVLELSQNKNLTRELTDPLWSYLRSLPDFHEDRACDEQSETVKEQHQYLQIIFSRAIFSENPDRSFASVLAPRQKIRLPFNNPLTALVRLISEWVKKYPGGILVFDMLPCGGLHWELFASHTSKWIDQGATVFFGVGGEDDIPKDLKQFYSRLQRKICF